MLATNKVILEEFLMTHFIKSLFLFGILIITSACSVIPKTAEGEKIRLENDIETGFIFLNTLTVRDEFVGRNGCKLYVTKIQDQTHLELNIDYGRKFTLVKAEPGSYFFEELSCGRHGWNLNSNIPFHVTEKKISMAAPFTVVLDWKDSSKNGIYIKYSVSDLRDLINLYESLREEQKMNLISGYTSKNISSELLLLSGPEHIKFVYPVKPTHCVNFDILSSSLDKCLQNEEKVNHLILGVIKLKVLDNPNVIQFSEEKSSQHSFSKEFVSCVENVRLNSKEVNKCVKKYEAKPGEKNYL